MDLEKAMKTKQLIKALIEAETESQRIEFYSLDSRGQYSSKQKRPRK